MSRRRTRARTVQADRLQRRAHADRLLADRDTAWKVKTSTWIVGVIAGVGCASAIGWWIVVSLTQARRYWWIASIYSAAAVIALVLFGLGFDEDDQQVNALVDIGGFGFLGVWAIASIHAVFEIRPVLRERVLRLSGGTPNVRVRVVEHGTTATEHDDYLAGKAHRAGVDLGEYYDPARRPETEEGDEPERSEPGRDDRPPGRWLDV